jgi:hypothetical protein
VFYRITKEEERVVQHFCSTLQLGRAENKELAFFFPLPHLNFSYVFLTKRGFFQNASAA